MAPRTDRREGGAAPAGFTLVEYLVATVLATIIGGAVLSLILSQNRFYARHAEYLRARQLVRATGDLVAGELRMAGPGDLLAADADSVSVRFDVSRGVVCGATPALDEATVFVFDSVTNANLPGGTLGYAVSAPSDSGFVYDDGWAPAVDLSAAAKTTCIDRGARDHPESWRYRILTGWSSSALGGTPEPGSLLRKYGRLTYRFDPSSFGSGTALWRNDQELVAPFESGAAFSYVLAGGDTVSSPGSLADVRAVRLTATAVGEEDSRVEVRRELEFLLWLRNER